VVDLPNADFAGPWLVFIPTFRETHLTETSRMGLLAFDAGMGRSRELWCFGSRFSKDWTFDRCFDLRS